MKYIKQEINATADFPSGPVNVYASNARNASQCEFHSLEEVMASNAVICWLTAVVLLPRAPVFCSLVYRFGFGFVLS